MEGKKEKGKRMSVAGPVLKGRTFFITGTINGVRGGGGQYEIFKSKIHVGSA